MVYLTESERKKFIEYAESFDHVTPPCKFTWRDVAAHLRSIATDCPQSIGDDLLPEEPRIEWPADGLEWMAWDKDGKCYTYSRKPMQLRCVWMQTTLELTLHHPGLQDQCPGDWDKVLLRKSDYVPAPKTFAEHLDAALDSGQPPMAALNLAVQKYAEGRR